MFSKTADTSLKVYGDADYAGDLEGRRSTSGFVFVLSGGAVAWASKLQSTVALSTQEAEYIAAALVTREALWMNHILTPMRLAKAPVVIQTDNQAALKLTKDHVTSQRAKHIDVVYHFVRDRVAKLHVKFEYCPTNAMIADRPCLTKAVTPQQLAMCKAGIGLV